VAIGLHRAYDDLNVLFSALTLRTCRVDPLFRLNAGDWSNRGNLTLYWSVSEVILRPLSDSKQTLRRSVVILGLMTASDPKQTSGYCWNALI
jgi:hypothetical protein